MSDARLHGYTMVQLDQLAQRAARACRSRHLSFADRADEAWSAIAEHLCASSDQPNPRELVVIGARAADHEAQRMLYKEHGWRPSGKGRNFERYWTTAAQRTPIEERLVEAMALAQIWPQLTPAMRKALVALAIHGDLASAAESVGYRSGAYRNMLYKARRRFLRLWLEPETPTGKWGHDPPRRGGERDYFVTTMTIRRRNQWRAAGDGMREAHALKLRLRRAALKTAEWRGGSAHDV